MKQIDIIKTYAQKRCLIVDDIPDVRTALKRILVDFGCSEVDTAGHAQEAIEFCEKKHYDIVLADYNLGRGKNGQQLLEELRFHGLLKNTALYVMITAEMTSQHVINALEYQPDDYLNKPINKDGLRPRLDLALLKNEALIDVKRALDLKKPANAILACKRLLIDKNRFQNDALRMLGELLIEEKQFHEAQELISKLPQSKRPLWAQLIYAQCLVGLHQIESAEQSLLELIQENQYCIDAYDLLSEVYWKTDRHEQAQHILSKGIKISPMSATRQRALGSVSRELGDETTASLAYRSAIKHSKNSCNENPEDYTSLADSLVKQMQQDSGNAFKLTVEAQDIIQQVERRYDKQPIVCLRSKLISAEIFDTNGETEMAEKACQEALEIHKHLKFSVLENTSMQLSIDCARSLMARGKYDEGEKLLQEIAKINRDPDFTVKIDKLLRDPTTKEGIQYASELNKRGIEYYRGNKIDDAIQAFKQVLAELPNHIGLNLNLIQALISKSKYDALDEQELNLIGNSFQRIGNLDSQSHYLERYDYLMKRYQKLLPQPQNATS
ncbi:Chemotaxis protein CheY [Thalassocella blandensis]|nr:Chemotaxis protein CheY [Thalassocella blandensis]